MIATSLTLLVAVAIPAPDAGARPTIEIRLDEANALSCGFRHVDISGTEEGGATLVAVTATWPCVGDGVPQTRFARESLHVPTTRKLVRDLEKEDCIEAELTTMRLPDGGTHEAASPYVSVRIGSRRCVGWKQMGEGLDAIWSLADDTFRAAPPVPRTIVARPLRSAPGAKVVSGGACDVEWGADIWRCSARAGGELRRYGRCYPGEDRTTVLCFERGTPDAIRLRLAGKLPPPQGVAGRLPSPMAAILEGGTRCEATSAEVNARHYHSGDALACSDGTVVETLFQGETWVAERHWPADKRTDYVPVERVEL